MKHKFNLNKFLAYRGTQQETQTQQVSSRHFALIKPIYWFFFKSTIRLE